MRTHLPVCALVIALSSVGGCGYKAGGPYRTDVHTVCVEMVGSREFRRDMEFQLTEALKKRIGTNTPYKLAPREKADTILTAELLEERQTAFAPDYRSRQPREKTLTLAVKLLWKDVRTGRILVDQPVELQAVDYLTPTGETEKFAQEKAVDALARQIVEKMYEDW